MSTSSNKTLALAQVRNNRVSLGDRAVVTSNLAVVDAVEQADANANERHEQLMGALLRSPR